MRVPKRLADDSGDESTALRSNEFLQQAMDRWGDSVYCVALSQTGSPADADDVYQDVFLRLLRDTTAFASDDHLKAWLLRVTVNRCHDLERLAWNRRTGPLKPEHAAIEAPDAFRSDIWEVVGALPHDRRIVVHLFYVEGYSTDEIARILQCKPATVRTRLHRAREQLRHRLGFDSLDDPDKREELSHGQERQKAESERLPFDDALNACAKPSAT